MSCRLHDDTTWNVLGWCSNIGLHFNELPVLTTGVLEFKFIWYLRRFDKLIREGFSFWHISDINAIGFSQIKWHYDPDKFLYDSHSLSSPPDFHILCQMGGFLRFCAELCFILFFRYDIGMSSVSVAVHQVAIHRNNVIVWNLFCAAQVIKCYFAITEK